MQKHLLFNKRAARVICVFRLKGVGECVKNCDCKMLDYI